MNNKTVVVAPAIKVKFWKDIYKTLLSGTTPFHLVFVGHVRPNFKLPKNFTYIFCDKPASTCVEIAYRYAYKHIKDAEYIVNISDDLQLAPTFLDELVLFYNQQIEKQKTNFLMVGPISLQASGEENLMAVHSGGPTLLSPAFTTIKNSKKIGGIDKRFQGIYWDCDRHLRVHERGGKIIFADCDEVTPVLEIEHSPGLYVKYRNHDRTFLDEIWSYDKNKIENIVLCAELTKKDHVYKLKYKRNRNKLIENKMSIKRLKPVLEYTDEEIGEYYE